MQIIGRLAKKKIKPFAKYGQNERKILMNWSIMLMGELGWTKHLISTGKNGEARKTIEINNTIEIFNIEDVISIQWVPLSSEIYKEYHMGVLIERIIKMLLDKTRSFTPGQYPNPQFLSGHQLLDRDECEHCHSLSVQSPSARRTITISGYIDFETFITALKY